MNITLPELIEKYGFKQNWFAKQMGLSQAQFYTQMHKGSFNQVHLDKVTAILKKTAEELFTVELVIDVHPVHHYGKHNKPRTKKKKTATK